MAASSAIEPSSIVIILTHHSIGDPTNAWTLGIATFVAVANAGLTVAMVIDVQPAAAACS